MRLPEGIHELREGRTAAFATPDAEAWVRSALARGERLHEAAARAAETTLSGRGPVPVVATPRGRWVVRRYRRGGHVAALLTDRYLRLGDARPVREARASGELLRRGISTPRVVAGAIYPAGAFYRADLVTEFVPGTVDLARLLFEDERAEQARIDVLADVGRLLARTAAAGVEHPDVNAKNILVEVRPAGAGPLLIDLDRCILRPPGERVRPDRMIARLARSLRKHQARTGRPVLAREWAALDDAARARSGA